MSRTVLVVDDSAAMRQLVTSTLRNAGFEPAAASNGVEALGMLAGGRYDMIITDLNMPGMDGIEFIRAVRSMEPHRFIPIIMLTTESHLSRKQEGRAAGASGWVVKPFSPASLLGVVRKFVEQGGA